MWLKNSLLEDLITNLSAHETPLELFINDIFLRIWRASAQITIRGLLSDWTAEQNWLPKIYFQYDGRKDSHIALGSLFQTEQFPQIRILTNPYGFSPKLYGGVSNMRVTGRFTIWKNFPKAIFFLPQIEVETISGKSFLHLYFLDRTEAHKKGIMQRLSKLEEGGEREETFTPILVSRKDFPTRKDWDLTVKDLLKKISSGKIEKAVIARQSSFTYTDSLSISSLLRLLQKIESGTLFSMQFSPRENFIGVTPELLYFRRENRLEIMALAGTASLLQSRHLQREKEQKEFCLVKEFIYEAMKTLCITIDSTPDITYPTGSLVHLRRIYRGKLLPFINDQEILKTVHPTPAISGFPRQMAADFLQKIEFFDRGWYASPIGYVSEKETRLYIAIRSACVVEKNLHLFSGAGIVKGSLPEKEWEELEKKTKHFFDSSA